MRLAPWEQWLTAVTDARRTATGSHGRIGDAQPRQSVSFRLVMAVLARYADHDTGTNARPSLRRLQTLTHLSHATVRKALDTAEELGFITAAGTWTPPKGGDQITVWSLGYPTPTGFVGWESVTRLDRTTDGDSAGPNHRNANGDSAGPNHRDNGSVTRLESIGDSARAQVGDSVQPNTTSSTSRPQGSEEDDESASAPAPEGADTTRLEADVFAVLGQRWPDDQPVVSKRSRRLLRELLAGGWAESQIIRAVKGIPKNPRNPALLLETHLAKVLAEHEPRDVGPVSDVGTATGDPALAVDQADDIPRCRHGVSRRLPKGSCAACVDHHDQLRAAFAEAERHGFTVNRGAKDDDGERPFNLIAGNVRIGVYLDKYEDPFDVWIEARRPSRDLLVFMYQFGDVEADQDGAHTVDVALDADQDGTPRVVAGLAKSLASLRHRDTQPKETA